MNDLIQGFAAGWLMFGAAGWSIGVLRRPARLRDGDWRALPPALCLGLMWFAMSLVCTWENDPGDSGAWR